MLHQTQELPPHVTENVYIAEEETFTKTDRKISVAEVPTSSDIIRSHMIYKIKERDDKTLYCKARIAPHGNEDCAKAELKPDSSTCPPSGIRVLLSLCVLHQFSIVKVDIKSAFLQSGHALRDVYVMPPRECPNRRFCWLLELAAYGLVNANAKWQKHSDDTYFKHGPQSVVFIPQLFYLMQARSLSLIVVKADDDIHVGGPSSLAQDFVYRLSRYDTLGTVVSLPGSIKFFGSTI